MAATGLDVLFGAPAGQALGQELDREQAEGLARIAMNNASARLHHAQAAEKETEAADAQWMQTAGAEFTRLMGEAGAIADPEEQALAMGKATLDFASLAYASGRPALAAKWGKIGAETVSVARQAELRRERVDGEKQKQALEVLDRGAGMANAVTDQASWDQQRMLVAANPQWGIDFSGLPDRFEDAKPILQAYARGSQKVADQIRQGQADEEHKRKIKADEDRRKYYNRTAGIMERNATTREKAETRRAKYGGKPVGVPSQTGIFMARDQLEKYADENGLKIDKDDKGMMADSIAARSAAIMKSVPGIDLAEATQRAIQEARDSKDFSVQEGVLSFLPDWIGPKPALKFEGRGRSAAAPVPLPPNAEALIKGKWYELPQGVGQWNGVDFDLAEEEPEETED